MARSILFRIKLKGNGIVNYDSGEQKSTHKDYRTRFENRTEKNNVTFCKKNFYLNEEGKLDWKVKIASNCLFNHLFKDDILSQNPSIQKSNNILYNFISSPINILRGYVFANANANTIKKKSPICITDAEQISNNISSIEVMTKSGCKTNEETKSDTFFFKENVGQIEYASSGMIDLTELQFLSCSEQFDRFGFTPDLINLFNKFFNLHIKKLNLEEQKLEIKKYIKKGNINRISEEGIVFNQEIVIAFVKLFFERLLTLKIQRHGAYAEISELEYKIVNNVFSDTFTNVRDWITIEKIDDINSMSFMPEISYEECPELDASNTEKEIAEYNDKNSKEKEKKKTAELEKKSKKKTENNE